MRQVPTSSRRLNRCLFLAIVSLSTAVAVPGQQPFITSASGPQSGNTSTRHVIASVTVAPPAMPGNAANLVFQGRGGTPFPAGTTTFLFGGGIPDTQIGFAPDAGWL